MGHLKQLFERGIAGGIVMAAAFAGFAGFLFLLFHLIKLARPKGIRQEEKQILSHRLYPLSGRGRAAYLILCIEEALLFYRQDFTSWEWVLQKLWSITNCSAPNWIELWLDTVSLLLPSVVLTAEGNDTSITEETKKARALYVQAGSAMIVIHSILESLFSMVAEWSPDTTAHDPDGLYTIREAEETMGDFHVPLPSSETVQLLLLTQKDSSLGTAFDGLCFSHLSSAAAHK